MQLHNVPVSLLALVASGSWVDLVHRLAQEPLYRSDVSALRLRLPTALWNRKTREVSRIQLVLAFANQKDSTTPRPEINLDNRRDLDSRLHYALNQSGPAAVTASRDCMAAGYVETPRRIYTQEIRRFAREKKVDFMLRAAAMLDVFDGTEVPILGRPTGALQAE